MVDGFDVEVNGGVMRRTMRLLALHPNGGGEVELRMPTGVSSILTTI